MNKEEKIVEHRNSGLMFGNLACIPHFTIFTVLLQFLMDISEHLKMIHDLSENFH